MARTCLFCNRTDLTLEHVWPEWISKFLFGEPRKARFTATQWRGVDRKTVARYRAPELNHQARMVCENCNGGWMSDIEATTTDILQPMLLGRTVQLSNYEQTVIRAWVTLRVMILERAAADTDARHFHTQEERLRFKEMLEPPDGMYLWLFQYRSPRWAARSQVSNMGLNVTPGRPSHHLQVITAFVGKFGFQMVTARWPVGRRIQLNSPHERTWSTATNLIWPEPRDTVVWPNEYYLADDSFEQFMNRWSDAGFPLRRRKR